MKILLPVKHVVDYNVKVHVNSGDSSIDTGLLAKSMNPFDAIAVEQALRLKEKDSSYELIAVTIGPESSKETLVNALAMGADHGIHIQAEQLLEPIHIANILSHIVSDESIDLVLMGKQAIDDDANQTGQMLASLLDWPNATCISSLTIDNNIATISREVDDGIMHIECDLPAVITTDLRLNQPRYISLPNRMKAKSKPLIVKILDDITIDTAPHSHIVSVEPTKQRPAGIKIDTIEELIAVLQKQEIES